MGFFTECLIHEVILNYLFLLLSDPPQVSIQLGRSLVASDIREGVDVYFDCLISANPIPKSKLVTWLHNVSTILSLSLSYYCIKNKYFKNNIFGMLIMFWNRIYGIFNTRLLSIHHEYFEIIQNFDV